MPVAETVVLWLLVSTTYEIRSEVANRSLGCGWWMWRGGGAAGAKVLAAQWAE